MQPYIILYEESIFVWGFDGYRFPDLDSTMINRRYDDFPSRKGREMAPESLGTLVLY
jgi:hypothetical protein